MVTISPAGWFLARGGRILRPAILVAFIGACDGSGATAPSPGLAAANASKAKKPVVRITPQNDTVDALGETIQLTANVSTPIWTSLTPGIVTVDAAGRVLSVGTGLGLVQATAGRKADTAEVLVRQIPASLTVSPDTLHFIFSDEPQALTAMVADANGFSLSPQPVIAWSSDDESVATVSAHGAVTATLGEGFTWIRAVLETLTDSAFVNTPATPYP